MATPSLSQLQRALAIAEQIQKLEEEFRTLMSSASSEVIASYPAAAAARGRGRGRKPKSQAPRATGRAASAKAETAAAGGTNSPSGNGSKSPSRKKRRVLSPEGRARIAAALKARWEKAKKAGTPAPNARKK